MGAYFGKSSLLKSKSTRVLINFSQTLFSIYMNVPDSGMEYFKADNATWAKYNIEDLIYVNSINFGKRVLVIVDSDDHYEQLRYALNNLFSEQKLSDQEQQIIDDATIRIMHLNANNSIIKPISSLADIINFIKAPISLAKSVVPISFSTANIKDSAPYINNYSTQ